MPIRKDQIRLRGRLVHRRRERDFEGDAAERLPEARRGGQSKCGITSVNEHRAHVTCTHRLDGLLHRREASGRCIELGSVVVDRSPDVSGNRVQDCHRDVGRRGTTVQPSDTGAQRQARALREPLSEFADTLGFDSHDARNVLGVVSSDDIAVGTRVGSPTHNIGHRERNQSLSSRLDRQPLVGVLSGQGEAGPHKREVALTALFVHAAHACESPSVPNRRKPALQEVRTERYKGARLFQIVPRNNIPPKDDPTRLPEWCLGKRVVPDNLPASPASEVRHQARQGRPDRSRKQVVPPGGRQALRDHLLRVLPRDRLEFFTLPEHRTRKTIRVVERLEARVATRAK